MKDFIDERDHIFNKVGLTCKKPIDLHDAYVALDVEIGYENLNVLEIIEPDNTKDTWLYAQLLVTPFHAKNIIEANHPTIDVNHNAQEFSKCYKCSITKPTW
jgi:hypothetical protein